MDRKARIGSSSLMPRAFVGFLSETIILSKPEKGESWAQDPCCMSITVPAYLHLQIAGYFIVHVVLAQHALEIRT